MFVPDIFHHFKLRKNRTFLNRSHFKQFASVNLELVLAITLFSRASKSI